ncbi:hypothetical protein JMJ78_0000925 [Colletotrichum scovillei]|nr:hypothetical protein JMJ78_0000925 [Colletotrichum scovillei]
MWSLLGISVPRAKYIGYSYRLHRHPGRRRAGAGHSTRDMVPVIPAIDTCIRPHQWCACSAAPFGMLETIQKDRYHG